MTAPDAAPFLPIIPPLSEQAHVQSGPNDVAFSNIGHGLTHLFMLLYATVVLALEKELNRPYGELLSLSLAGYILFGAGSIPAGWLADRWSGRGMMALFFFGIGGASVFTGLADGPAAIAIGLALLGLFASIYHPVGIALIVSNAANPGRSLGYNGVSGSIGVAVAALVAGALTDWISWRAAFIIPGAVAIATGVVFLLFARGGRINKRTSKEHGEQPDVPRRTMIHAMAVFFITLLCAGLIYQVMSVAMPKIVAERVSDINIMGTLGVGGLVTAVYLSSSFAQILGGYLADRFPLKTVYILSYLIQAPVFFFAAMAGGYPLLILATASIALGVGAAPAETTLISRYSPAKWRATAFGAKFAVALGVSALGVPMIALIYENTGGFYWLFVTLGVLAAILAAAAILLPSPDGKEALLPGAAAPEAGVQGD